MCLTAFSTSKLTLVTGITNQRETTVAWSRSSGKPLCRAIVWTDSRTRNTATHYERLMDSVGIEESPGVFRKGDDGREYLKELYVFSPWVQSGDADLR